LVVAALIFDFLHYAWSTAAWGSLQRHKERHGTKESDEFLAPAWINWPSNVFFWAKVIAVGIAYVMLGVYLFDRLL